MRNFDLERAIVRFAEMWRRERQINEMRRGGNRGSATTDERFFALLRMTTKGKDCFLPRGEH